MGRTCDEPFARWTPAANRCGAVRSSFGIATPRDDYKWPTLHARAYLDASHEHVPWTICLADVQIDARYVGKPNRYVYTNALVGDPGLLNGVQRGDLKGESGAVWTTHVSERRKPLAERLLLSSCTSRCTAPTGLV